MLYLCTGSKDITVDQDTLLLLEFLRLLYTESGVSRTHHRASLLSFLLTNVRSLENKLDYLQQELTLRKEIRDCCDLIFTKSKCGRTRHGRLRRHGGANNSQGGQEQHIHW
ncbi:hypothetical protein AMECASPLE_038346 [Ameca splendens]|uniref:Uncharacterized protein n=1 Tax=Ameca splendens TaxID=208324 RepID=A0ABV0ZHY6_9TELE